MDAQQLLVMMATVGDPLGPYLTSLGGGVEGTPMFQGVPLELKHNTGSKNSPPSLDIRLRLPFPCPLAVRSETGIDRMAKAIGLAYEIQSGDLMFDRKYYVECEHRSFAVPFLSSSDHRDAARQLLQEIPHANHVRGDHDGVTLCISPFKEDQFNKTHLDQALPLLKRFGSEIPQMPPFPRRINPYIPLFIIGWLVFIVGVAAYFVGISEYETLDNPFVYSLRYSIPAIIALLALAFVMLRGRSTALTEFLLVAVIPPVGFVFLSLGGTICVNGYYDDSRPVEHVASVTRKWKTSKNYWVSFTSWREKSAGEQMNISSAEYNGLNTGGRLRIVTRKGRLGFERIVSWEKETSR